MTDAERKLADDLLLEAARSLRWVNALDRSGFDPDADTARVAMLVTAANAVMGFPPQ